MGDIYHTIRKPVSADEIRRDKIYSLADIRNTLTSDNRTAAERRSQVAAPASATVRYRCRVSLRPPARKNGGSFPADRANTGRSAREISLLMKIFQEKVDPFFFLFIYCFYLVFSKKERIWQEGFRVKSAFSYPFSFFLRLAGIRLFSAFARIVIYVFLKK
ncbi:hypothetical protein CB343_003547 [Salmonella enterica subsp. diarizonae]|nr:hypothetical protein [Salmonella enterica subsp. diarizonae]